MCPHIIRLWYTGSGRTRLIHRTLLCLDHGAGLPAFGVGVAIGRHGVVMVAGAVAGNNEININASRQNNFTKNNYNRPEQHQNKGQNWQHNPQNRGGAQYKNQATAQKYGQQRSGSGGRATTST